MSCLITRLRPTTSSTSFLLRVRQTPTTSVSRFLHTTRTINMPEQLKQSEVDTNTDPSVAKQYDDKTPAHTQFEDLYKIVDDIKIGLLTTVRPNIGPVSRAMAVSKRVGPDFLFLANNHSKKFKDISANSTVQITFQDNKSTDWVSVTGEATSTSNSDPRIKELHSKPIKAWFGDLGDGTHDGSPSDPRMSLIEVKSAYITYWKKEVSQLGFVKEIAQSTLTGSVAQTGVLRELDEAAIQKARAMA